jgi:hypothetical protein
MKCYLAHPVTDYGGSARQLDALAAIEAKGWEAINPDQPLHQRLYKAHGMQHFLELVEDCDALAFMRFADGAIGAGVGKEIEAALRRGLHLYEIKGKRLDFYGSQMMPMGLLSVDETRAKIAELRALSPIPHVRQAK